MLTVRAEQMRALNQVAQDAFTAELAAYLCAAVPGWLSRFPQDVRLRIAANIRNRAESLGVTWKSTIGLFGSLMLQIAPNFPDHPQIAEKLLLKCPADNRIKALPYNVPSAAWAQARANRCNLPLFIPEDMDQGPPALQLRDALPLVLWDFPEREILPLAANAERAAERFGLRELTDGPLIVAAWRALYGPRYADRTRYQWLDAVFFPERPPRERLELLRLRIALDHDRRL